jgi:flagellar hook-length control protein FliK
MPHAAIQVADLLIPAAAAPRTLKPSAPAAAPRKSLLPDRPKAGTDAREPGRPIAQPTRAETIRERAADGRPARSRAARGEGEDEAPSRDTGELRVPFAALLKLLAGEPVDAAELATAGQNSAAAATDGHGSSPVATAVRAAQAATRSGAVATAPGAGGETGAVAQANGVEGQAVASAAAGKMPGEPAAQAADANANGDGTRPAGESATPPQQTRTTAQARPLAEPAGTAPNSDTQANAEARVAPQAGRAQANAAEAAVPQAGGNGATSDQAAQQVGHAGVTEGATPRPVAEPQAAQSAEVAQRLETSNQLGQDAPQTAAANTNEARTAASAASGQSSGAGADSGRGDGAAERLHAALRRAAGPDSAETAVTTKAEPTDVHAEPQQAAVQATGSPASASSPGTQPAGSAAQTTARTPAAQVADSVAESVQAGSARPGRQVTVRLNPPELGSVRITFESDGDQLRGVLEVSNARTLGELQRELPALMNRLNDAGVTLRRMDLNLSDDGSGGSQLPDFAEGDADGRGSAAGGSQTAADDEPNADQPAEPAVAEVAQSPQVGDDALNVWI